MRRRVIGLLTAFSTVLLVGVLFLWLTSYYRYRVLSYQGRVLLLVVKADTSTDYWLRVKPPRVGDWQGLRTDNTVRVAGIEFEPPRTKSRHTYTYYDGPSKGESFVKLNYWLLAVP